MYCIFYVVDYKGGELVSRINLSRDEFIRKVIDNPISDFIWENPEATNEEILKKFTNYEDPDWENLYAYETSGGYEFYKIENNKLITIDPLDEITEADILEIAEECRACIKKNKK